MEKEVEALRERIDQVARGGDGRRIFTAAIRGDVIALGKKWKASGRQMSKLAKALDVHKTTLRAWVLGAKARKPARVIRAVKVAADPARVEGAKLVVVLPSGVRLEGLDLSGAIELVRALS